jgi:hypothetical protein
VAFFLFLKLMGLFSGVGIALCWMPVLRPVVPTPVAFSLTFAPTALLLLGLLFADDRNDDGETVLARIARPVGRIGAALQGVFVCASMMRVAAWGWPAAHVSERWLIGIGWAAGVYGSIVGARVLRQPSETVHAVAAIAPYAPSDEITVAAIGALFACGALAVLIARPAALEDADVVGAAALFAVVGAVGAVSWWERRTLAGHAPAASMPRLWWALRGLSAFAAGLMTYAYATRPSKQPALGVGLVLVLSVVALWPAMAQLAFRVGLGVRYRITTDGLVEFHRDYELTLPWRDMVVSRGEFANNAALFVHVDDVGAAVGAMRFPSHIEQRRRDELRCKRLQRFEKTRAWQGADCTILGTQACAPLAAIYEAARRRR